jgi:hypothetical protein
VQTAGIVGAKQVISDDCLAALAPGLPRSRGTVFWQPLITWRADNMTRDKAIAEITQRYPGFAKDSEAGAAR